MGIREFSRRARGGESKTRPLVLQPPLKAVRSLGEESGEQVTAVQLKCRRMVSGLNGFAKCCCITPECTWVETELTGSPTDDAQPIVVIQFGAKESDSLVECIPTPRWIKFGPKHRQQGVPTMKAARYRQEHQQRQPLRLGEDPLEFDAVVTKKLGGSENLQANHTTLRQQDAKRLQPTTHGRQSAFAAIRAALAQRGISGGSAQ
jgi:hypothetical protein